MALRQLGFQFSEESESDATIFPAQSLIESLKHGPVMIGPLDMGELDYQPHSRMRVGSDHYVIVLSIENEDVVVHDPGGYPFAHISIDALKKAWQAEKIS